MDFHALATECAPWVEPQTMAAIVRTESQFKPYAININGGARLERQPASKEEAVVTAKWLIANKYNIDMGLGQINSVNLAKTNLSVEDAFDECKNLAASATILKWNYDSASKQTTDEQAALGAAISAYNTGSFTKGFSNGYVQKVVKNAHSYPSAEVKQTQVIEPIPVINLANKLTAKPVKTHPDTSATYKVKVVKTDEVAVNQNSVYEGDRQTSNVMVYR
jgi:type IV secretion system protein VirB1